ncbi:SDR family oxidoreductase [Streptosporangium canum]|uniref:SDR family oxidoreductase n=1 Tax=Streptosporangium canum TaxID=324952 RepID=UPI0037A94B04
MPHTAHAASKGALARITRVLAIEGGRSNAVLPGVIDTDIMEGVVDNGREMLASLGPAHPVGRIGQPHEVETIAFLASDAASFLRSDFRDSASAGSAEAPTRFRDHEHDRLMAASGRTSAGPGVRHRRDRAPVPDRGGHLTATDGAPARRLTP